MNEELILGLRLIEGLAKRLSLKNMEFQFMMPFQKSKVVLNIGLLVKKMVILRLISLIFI